MRHHRGREQKRSNRPTGSRQRESTDPEVPDTAGMGRERVGRGDQVWLYGHHAVAAALGNPERRVLRLAASPEAYERLRADAAVPPQALIHATRVSRRDIDALVGEAAVHQGVALLTQPLHHAITDIIEIAAAQASAALCILDQVNDPQNVGAILRSAAAFGAAAVIAPDRHAPAETGAMAKAASGALDRIAYVRVVNVARTIDVLKDSGFWVIGMAADGTQTLAEIDLTGRVALVLGTEGEGLRRLVRDSCDHVARLPIREGIDSLNVSNAAAVALYERARQLGAARDIRPLGSPPLAPQ